MGYKTGSRTKIRSMAERVEVWPLTKLIPYARNARTHSDEQIEKIARSIEEFGFTNPILVDGDSGIMAGHGRLLAAKKLGMDNVPVIPLTHLNEHQKRAYIIADNRLALDAGWDEDLLSQELKELEKDDFNLDVIGFSDEELGEYLKDVDVEKEKEGIEDYIPEVKKTKTKAGNLWLLGDHRVLCGDCTVKENVDRLMQGEKADMVSMDPPYGELKIFSKDGKNGPDNLAKAKKYGEYAGHETFRMEPVFEALEGIPQKFVLWGGNYFTHLLPVTTSWLCWDKTANEDGGSWFSDFELAWTNLGIPARKFRYVWQGMIRQGKREERTHPTQKPVALYEWQFSSWTNSGETVLEMPIGSGSALIACEKTGRKCYGMEIDPHYCDVIVKRWEEYSGKKAKLEKK